MLRYVILVVLMFCISSTYTSDLKKCRIRDLDLLLPEYFKLVSGAFCYNYTEDSVRFNHNFRFSLTPKTVTGEDDEDYTIYVIQLSEETVYFDYTNETYTDRIRILFSDEKYYNKWKECAEAAMDCCLNKMNNRNVMPSQSYPCPHTWDAFSCYPQTEALTTATHPCPTYIIEANSYDVCQLESRKECLRDSWNQQTIYKYCDPAEKYRERYNVHLIVLYISVAVMVPSVIILFYFRNLRILRIALHRNVIISILVKNILVIISKTLIILDAIAKESNEVMLQNGVPCRILAFFENVSKNAIFTCMLVDSFYLHKLIVRSFKEDPKIWQIYLSVAIGSFTPTIIWVGFKISNNNNNCWMVDTYGYQWITDGYKYGTLVINCILLVDILRILCTKFGKNSTNKTQTKTALKATLILLPIFGVPLIITSQRNLLDSNDCLSSDIYNYTTYVVEGLQGVLLSVFFCYLNAEVHNEIIKEYEKIDRCLRDKFGLEHRRTTIGRRRTTGLTNISGKF